MHSGGMPLEHMHQICHYWPKPAPYHITSGPNLTYNYYVVDVGFSVTMSHITKDNQIYGNQ